MKKFQLFLKNLAKNWILTETKLKSLILNKKTLSSNWNKPGRLPENSRRWFPYLYWDWKKRKYQQILIFAQKHF